MQTDSAARAIVRIGLQEFPESVFPVFKLGQIFVLSSRVKQSPGVVCITNGPVICEETLNYGFTKYTHRLVFITCVSGHLYIYPYKKNIQIPLVFEWYLNGSWMVLRSIMAKGI